MHKTEMLKTSTLRVEIQAMHHSYIKYVCKLYIYISGVALSMLYKLVHLF